MLQLIIGLWWGQPLHCYFRWLRKLASKRITRDLFLQKKAYLSAHGGSQL